MSQSALMADESALLDFGMTAPYWLCLRQSARGYGPDVVEFVTVTVTFATVVTDV
jgi:hypothetical protein